MKLGIVISILLTLSFLFGRLSSPTLIPLSPKESLSLAPSQKLISSQDIQAYLEIKDKSEQRYKADEILNKAMLLLLTNIGLKIDEASKNEIQKVAQTPYQDVYLEDKKTEVFYDKTTHPSKEETQCPSVQEKQCPESKTKDLRLEKLKSWMNFKNANYKYLRSKIDRDIFRDFWASRKSLQGQLKPILLDHVQAYLGDSQGQVRLATGINSDIELSLELLPEVKNNEIKVKLNLVASDGSLLIRNARLRALHPQNHIDGQGGYCRGLVLKNSDLEIYLSKLKSSSGGILVKLYLVDSGKIKKKRLHSVAYIIKKKP